MKALIQKLVETVGPSGHEKALRDLVRAEIGGAADEMRVDALGNLIARKGSKREGGLRVMLSAHMDEIGIIATHIDANGFVRFTTIGGVSPMTCLGGRVRFLNGTAGVIGAERLEGYDKFPTLEQLFVDVGATSKEDCPVRVGDMAGFDRPFVDMGERMVAKSMDDRVSVAVLLETMRSVQDSPHELYFVFSTQEEVGLRGARVAAYGVDPDLGIAVDVTRTGDTPRSARMAVALGKGPAIKVRDEGMMADPRVVDLMVAAASRADVPYQLEVLERGSTDAAAIQLARAGVPSGCLSIPCRYIHSPSEMVDSGDVRNAVHLLAELLSGPLELA